jgi:hypothetical protein
VNQTAWSLSKSAKPRYHGNGTKSLIVFSTDGNLWIAMFASYRVSGSPSLISSTLKATGNGLDPQGKHLKDIVFSAKNMACTTWGGKNFDILFVATGKDRSIDAKAEDEGGHMFQYKPPGVKGSPKHEFVG